VALIGLFVLVPRVRPAPRGVRLKVCARKREVAAAARDPLVRRLCLACGDLLERIERG